MANAPIAPAKKKKFLDELAKTGNITKSCKAASVDRKTIYRHRKDDDEFKSLFEDALDQAADALEGEARRRAFQGVKKPVYQGGKRIGYVQEYSDTLLIFLLKGAKPGKYRERFETNQTNFDFNNADLSLLNDYEIERIIAGDDPRSVFAAASKRLTREKAKAS
jgi:hypothetical protein